MAFYQGIVLSTCKNCTVRHFVADNLHKLDMPEYADRVDQILEGRGEVVRRLTLQPNSSKDEFHILDDGTISITQSVG